MAVNALFGIIDQEWGSDDPVLTVVLTDITSWAEGYGEDGEINGDACRVLLNLGFGDDATNMYSQFQGEKLTKEQIIEELVKRGFVYDKAYENFAASEDFDIEIYKKERQEFLKK